MKNIKNFHELNESITRPGKTLPANGTRIRFVADVTDISTNEVLKQIWDAWSDEQRKKILKQMGHSEKYFDSTYDDLTGEIQSKIVWTVQSLSIK
jgi:hypothetical protein